MKRIATAVVYGLVAASWRLWAEQAIGPEVTISAQSAWEWTRSVAFNAAHDEYLVTWDGIVGPGFRVFAKFLDGYGRPKGATFQVGPGGDSYERSNAAAAYDSVQDRYLVVYNVHGNVAGRFIAWDGVNPSWTEFVIPRADPNITEDSPRVAYSPQSQKFLMVWEAGGLLRAALFGFGATPAAFQLAAFGRYPEVAHQSYGDNFLVVYTDSSDVFAKLVGPYGVPGAEITVAGWPDLESFPAVASCDNWQYLVAWDSSTPATDVAIYVRFLRGDGTFDGPPINISGWVADSSQRYPAVACAPGANEYLIAYSSRQGLTAWGTYGRRIGTDQSLRPRFPIRAANPGEVGVAEAPSVAGGGKGWFVAWQHTNQVSLYLDVHGRAVWLLFADGFESGNTDRWSSVTP